MSRVTVHHLTPVRRLPLIELDGLRTRVDLSGRLGPVEAFDLAAPAAFARGKRVSGWWSEEHALAQVATLGRGHVSYSVDPARVLAMRASEREADVERAWATARPLAAWLAEGEAPADLEVHQPLPVRAKHVRLHAPIVDDGSLGDWAPLVAGVSDQDRVAAKLLMHLALGLAADDLDGPAFLAAAAFAWRDEPDAADLSRRVGLADPEAVLTAVLAEQRTSAPAIV
ncbi:MAG: hypothetical protein RLZZ272_1378, partial [Actinomycetota bacterium]